MILLYDDYIEMKNKKPLGKVDEVPHYSDPPAHLDGYGGHLIDDYILIDVDDGDDADILYRIIQDHNINTIVRKTTRGYHFYFKNSGHRRNIAPTMCTLGLTIEVKRYGKKSFEPIKVDGEIREIVKNADFLDEIPDFLKLLKHSIDWKNLKNGDGRNQEFLKLQIKLAKSGIEYKSGKFIGQLINDYVLKEPLPQREFDTVWREEVYPSVVPNFYTQRGSFLHNVFGDYMIKKYHIININGVLHMYHEGVYESEYKTKRIQKTMLKEVPNIKDMQRKETLKYMGLIAEEKGLAPVRYILVNNGIYDFQEDRLLPFDHDKVFVNKIAYDYRTDAYHQDTERVLNKIACNDGEIYFLLTEIAGYCLYRKNRFRMCPILVGNGSNGKSTYIKMLEMLLGHDNYSSLSLDDLKSSFRPSMILNKLANLGDDIDNQYIKDTSTIKKLITGETIIVEYKGGQVFSMQSYATMVFSANDMALVSDKSYGWTSRVRMVPFNAAFKITDGDYDPFIETKVTTPEAMEYLLLLAIESMREVLHHNRFTEPEAVKLMTKEYEMENNSVLQFFNQFDDLDEYVVGKTRSEIVLSYEVFCHSEGLHVLSSLKISKYLKTCNLITKGKSRKYFKEYFNVQLKV